MRVCNRCDGLKIVWHFGDQCVESPERVHRLRNLLARPFSNRNGRRGRAAVRMSLIRELCSGVHRFSMSSNVHKAPRRRFTSFLTLHLHLVFKVEDDMNDFVSHCFAKSDPPVFVINFLELHRKLFWTSCTIGRDGHCLIL